MKFLFPILYRAAIGLYFLGIAIASLWNAKAKQWIAGRKNLLKKLSALPKDEYRVWFHCASTGEFEQGRPLIEAYRQEWPHHKIVLTFFSPSGFELRKNYSGADYIFYLPLDTRSNARKFIGYVRPQLAIFVKYEFWYNHLDQLKKNRVPTLLISGIFRPQQIFFRWYGRSFLNVLKSFRYIFLQDQQSVQLLGEHEINNTAVAGDTRFDRVWQIAEASANLSAINGFRRAHKLFIAGSTWPEDESLIGKLIQTNPPGWKWIIIPHEIDNHHLEGLKKHIGDDFILLSGLNSKNEDSNILVVDQVGLLSKIYSYGSMAYVGGGFGNGIHNILEAAVYGIPVLFGPRYQKFNEAKELLQQGAAASISNAGELAMAFAKFSTEKDGKKNREYVSMKKGATEKIMDYIRQFNSGNDASRG
jgi:3-deoxy-D-manno-octulosonic-acid transferase